jgi:hypothetical protein
MGPTRESDMAMAIYRAFQVDLSARRGLFYPVWAADFNYTYGSPLFAFYPPLVSYIILAFFWTGIGWVTAGKVAAAGFLLASGIGLYVYTRWLFAERRAALMAAIAYIWAPYLLTDIFERGAIAESLALALLPWLFWTAHHSTDQDGGLWPWLTGLLMALLILAHNITALFVLPVLLIYLALLAWRARVWRRTAIVFIALGFGIGISAFYWLPALLERNYTQITSSMQEGQYQVEAHLTSFAELIQLQLAFDYWGPQRFRLSLWQAGAASIALAALIGGILPRRHNLSVIAGILLGVVFLQTEFASPFWQSFPLVRFIQFPWRLLGIAAFCVAILVGALFTWRRLIGVLGWVVTGIFLVMTLYGSTALLGSRAVDTSFLLLDVDITLKGMFERGRALHTALLTPFSDFLPTSVKVDTRVLPEPASHTDSILTPMSYIPSIKIITDSPNRLAFQIDAEQPFTLRFHRFFFPGWQVYVGQQPVPTYPTGDLGLVTSDLPRGEYDLVVQFKETPLRRLANVTSLAFALAWIIAGIIIRRAKPVLVGLVLILVAYIALGLANGVTPIPARSPIAYPVNFEDEVFLLGFELPKTTWHSGDAIPLRLYWLARQVPSGDHKVFLHLVTPDDRHGVAQSDSGPILGYGPTSWWTPGEIIVDEQVVHLGSDVSVGRYLLLAGLYRLDPIRNLSVRQAPQILPGDRVVLTTIEISEK